MLSGSPADNALADPVFTHLIPTFHPPASDTCLHVEGRVWRAGGRPAP